MQMNLINTLEETALKYLQLVIFIIILSTLHFLIRFHNNIGKNKASYCCSSIKLLQNVFVKVELLINSL